MTNENIYKGNYGGCGGGYANKILVRDNLIEHNITYDDVISASKSFYQFNHAKNYMGVVKEEYKSDGENLDYDDKYNIVIFNYCGLYDKNNTGQAEYIFKFPSKVSDCQVILIGGGGGGGIGGYASLNKGFNNGGSSGQNASIYYRETESNNKYNINANIISDMKGWNLVRYLSFDSKNSINNFKDNLAGTTILNTNANNMSWSLNYSEYNYDQYLFASEDFSEWLVCNRNEINEIIGLKWKEISVKPELSDDHKLATIDKLSLIHI